MRDRAGEGGRRAGTCCGVSTPYCYNTTLTGLCNQTGLAHSRHRLHSLLYNCINCCSELRRSMHAGGRETQSHTHTSTFTPCAHDRLTALHRSQTGTAGTVTLSKLPQDVHQFFRRGQVSHCQQDKLHIRGNWHQHLLFPSSSNKFPISKSLIGA